MGLLSFTRYVFEMTVWLRLMSKDDEYGLLYGRELVKETRRHYKQLRDQLKREIPLLRGLEAGEGVSFEAELKKILEMPTGAGREAAALGFGRSVMHRTDRKASREFSLYHRKAATNGYAFQADLIADKLLPQLEKSLDGAEREWKQWGETPLKDERKRLLGTTKKGEEKPWVWSEQAKAAEMEHEYEFIYSYTSRLLHAGPMSITTNQKNLELQEVEMFLEYVHFRIVDISDMADRRLTQPRHLM